MDRNTEVEHFYKESRYKLTDFIPLIGALHYQDRTGNAELIDHPISKEVERRQAFLIGYTFMTLTSAVVGLGLGLETLVK